MIALVSWAFAAPLFSLYVLAYRAALQDDDEAVDRWLALTAPLWFPPTVYQIGQEDVLYSVLCGGAMLYGVCAFARWWMNRGEPASGEPEDEPRLPQMGRSNGTRRIRIVARSVRKPSLGKHDAEVLDSHRGGEQ